ncbi:expressed unknown protein [Seminavis robusta]|uniref:Uncharacterized protein n=1 Tax=Seminavis robusta TaxID=568900 RepID=A0A9N8DG66_9STRA|nr:expressed unknown protein [Seminavis robusta]|eukprot:Sro76_g041810.1 n/a (912) ;mRNA; f:119372-122107
MSRRGTMKRLSWKPTGLTVTRRTSTSATVAFAATTEEGEDGQAEDGQAEEGQGPDGLGLSIHTGTGTTANSRRKRKSRHVRFGGETEVHAIERKRPSMVATMFYNARDILQFKEDKFEEEAAEQQAEKQRQQEIKKKEKEEKKKLRKQKLANRKAKRAQGTTTTTTTTTTTSSTQPVPNQPEPEPNQAQPEPTKSDPTGFSFEATVSAASDPQSDQPPLDPQTPSDAQSAQPDVPSEPEALPETIPEPRSALDRQLSAAMSSSLISMSDDDSSVFLTTTKNPQISDFVNDSITLQLQKRNSIATSSIDSQRHEQQNLSTVNSDEADKAAGTNTHALQLPSESSDADNHNHNHNDNHNVNDHGIDTELATREEEPIDNSLPVLATRLQDVKPLAEQTEKNTDEPLSLSVPGTLEDDPPNLPVQAAIAPPPTCTSIAKPMQSPSKKPPISNTYPISAVDSSPQAIVLSIPTTPLPHTLDSHPDQESNSPSQSPSSLLPPTPTNAHDSPTSQDAPPAASTASAPPHPYPSLQPPRERQLPRPPSPPPSPPQSPRLSQTPNEGQGFKQMSSFSSSSTSMWSFKSWTSQTNKGQQDSHRGVAQTNRWGEETSDSIPGPPHPPLRKTSSGSLITRLLKHLTGKRGSKKKHKDTNNTHHRDAKQDGTGDYDWAHHQHIRYGQQHEGSGHESSGRYSSVSSSQSSSVSSGPLQAYDWAHHELQRKRPSALPCVPELSAEEHSNCSDEAEQKEEEGGFLAADLPMCSDDEDNLYAFLADEADPTGTTGTPPRRSSSLVRVMKKFISLGESDSHRKKKRKQGQGRNDGSDGGRGGGPNYSWEHHQDIKKAPKRKTSSFLRNLLESKSKQREKQGTRKEENRPAPTASALNRHRKFMEGQQREQKSTKTKTGIHTSELSVTP